MESWRAIAARDNAEWCDVVCHSHGTQTRFDDDAWTSSTRTPPYYPDAVTLAPECSTPDLLARVDASAGCSIKDSFASLDLTGHGFRILFDAQWIVLPETAPRPPSEETDWELVRDPDDIGAWIEAWKGEEITDVLRADVLDHDSVAVLAARSDDRIVAGAIATRHANVVGISNVFATGGVTTATWSGCVALARSLFARSTFVGYESGDDLAAAQDAGFQAAGLLRVWMRDG